MKRIGIAFLVLILAILPLAADPIIDLNGSNQNQSTVGFEFNDYDALVNPLQFEKIGGNRLFVALDVLTNLLGEDYDSTSSTKGLCAGLVLGVPFAPRFLIDYADGSSTETMAAADNAIVDRTNFNVATGRYATITEELDNLRTSYVHNARDLVFHAGMVIAPGIDLALQAYWGQRDYRISYLDYLNTYADTAEIAPAALTALGDRTETEINLPGAGNTLSFQVQAGLTFGNFSTLASLGAGIVGLAAPDASYRQMTTVYDNSLGFGLDATLRDRETVNEYSGATLWNGTTYVQLVTMDWANIGSAHRTVLSLDTQNKLAMGNGMELSFPVSANVSLYGNGLSSVSVNQTTDYDDALGEDASFQERSTTTTTTTLDMDYNLGFGVGAGIKKTFNVATDAAFYAGAELGLDSTFARANVSRTQATRTIIDLNSNGTLTPGTDTDVTVTLDGYENMRSSNNFDIRLSAPVGVTYTPFPKLSFHAGCVSYMTVGIDAVTSRDNDVGAYTYTTYTDALDADNDQERQPIDGVSDNATNTSRIPMSFDVEANSSFGFTLKISDKFSIDALASASNVSFSNFSVIGSIAF